MFPVPSADPLLNFKLPPRVTTLTVDVLINLSSTSLCLTTQACQMVLKFQRVWCTTQETAMHMLALFGVIFSVTPIAFGYMSSPFDAVVLSSIARKQSKGHAMRYT